MVFEYRNQPWRGIYLGYQSVLTVIRVPVWILLSVPKALRPRRSWTFKKTISMRLFSFLSPFQDLTSKYVFHLQSWLRRLIFLFYRTGFLFHLPNHLALEEGSDIKGVWVEPVPELILGDIKAFAEAADVHPVRIPGYWMDRTGSSIPIGEAPIPGEKILYGLHGGGYVWGSASSTDSTGRLWKDLINHCVSFRRSFAIEYRISRGPPYETEGVFPSALIDALAGYNYLIHVIGFRPEDVVFVGDSAGGNIALALTRYLVEYKPASLSPPGSLVLLSPWADISNSHYTPGTSYDHGKFDIVPLLFTSSCVVWATKSFLGPHGMQAAERSRYISPACRLSTLEEISFRGFPRSYITAGGAETLLDQIHTLKQRMVNDMGDEAVVYEELKDGIHDHLVFPFWEPERTETLDNIAAWLAED